MFAWRRASIYKMTWKWTARTYLSASIPIFWIGTQTMTLSSSISVCTWIWRTQRMNWLYLETEIKWVPFNKSSKAIRKCTYRNWFLMHCIKSRKENSNWTEDISKQYKNYQLAIATQIFHLKHCIQKKFEMRVWLSRG